MGNTYTKKEAVKNKLLKALLISLIVVLIVEPMTAIANAGEKEELDRITDEVVKYITINEQGQPEYDRARAEQNNVENDVLKVADQTYELMVGLYENEKSADVTPFPVYGNWCGPHYGSGTPIDLLDIGCKQHDECYSGKNMRHKCSCDEAFLRYVNQKYSKMTGAKQKAMAQSIVAWLEIKISNRNKTGGNFSCKI